MFVLPAIRKKSLTDVVEEKVIEAISRLKLGVGDSLPGELELAEQLQVSRNIVREAFSRLRMLGIIESRKKRGVVLKEADLTSGLRRILSLGMLSERTEKELRELRLIMELGMTDFVFFRKTSRDLVELEKIVRREEKNAKNRKISLECDIDFHSRLYEISQNETLNSFQSLLISFFQSKTEKDFIPNRFEDPEQITHRDLLETLGNGSNRDYRQMIYKHLNAHIKPENFR